MMIGDETANNIAIESDCFWNDCHFKLLRIASIPDEYISKISKKTSLRAIKRLVIVLNSAPDQLNKNQGLFFLAFTESRNCLKEMMSWIHISRSAFIARTIAIILLVSNKSPSKTGSSLIRYLLIYFLWAYKSFISENNSLLDVFFILKQLLLYILFITFHSHNHF